MPISARFAARRHPIRRGLVLAWCLSAAAAHAQGGHSLGSSEQLRFPSGQDTVSLPFENAGHHVIIPVSVNGSAPLMMVFDTGMPTAGVLLYAGAKADALRLAFGPVSVRVGGAGGVGGAAEAKLASGVTLRLGSLEIAGSVAIVMPPTPSMSRLHDGIIGASLFRNLVVNIDHDRGVMTLTRPVAFVRPQRAAVVPLELTAHSAYVRAGLVDSAGAETSLQLVLDLGAMHAVSLNARTNPAIRVPRRTKIPAGTARRMRQTGPSAFALRSWNSV